MDHKVACASDTASSAIHEAGCISLEDFIRMNNLDTLKVMSDPKYQRIVTYALALVNYTASLDQAASMARNENAGQH